MTWIYLCGIVVCIIFSNIFSSAEMSYSSCNRMRLEGRHEDGSKKAGVALKIVDKFDDSLSAVDTETDEKIRSALDRDLGGATTIIISHRITTLLDCDNILVLEKGRVSQLGSPKELLAQPGIFRKIYDMQMSIGEEEGA